MGSAFSESRQPRRLSLRARTDIRKIVPPPTHPDTGESMPGGLFTPAPTLCIVGYGRAGKDTMAEWLADNTPLRHGGSTSVHLTPYVVAHKYGCTVEEAGSLAFAQVASDEYSNRHANRSEWYEIGNRLRDTDRGVLVRTAMSRGHLLVGVRDTKEIAYGRESGLIDMVIWVSNNRYNSDPTVKFGTEVADVIIENHGTLAEYYRRIAAFARFSRIPFYTTD